MELDQLRQREAAAGALVAELATTREDNELLTARLGAAEAGRRAVGAVAEEEVALWKGHVTQLQAAAAMHGDRKQQADTVSTHLANLSDFLEYFLVGSTASTGSGDHGRFLQDREALTAELAAERASALEEAESLRKRLGAPSHSSTTPIFSPKQKTWERWGQRTKSGLCHDLP